MKLRLYKSVLTLVLFLISVAQTHAQAALLVLLFGDQIATEKFHLSIDAGTNFSTIEGLGNSNSNSGLYFGLGTHLKLNEKWELSPEFKPLSPRGVKNSTAIISYPTTLENSHYQIALNYIDVPILIQYKITPRIFIGTGPQFSFLTKAKQIATGKLTGGNEISITENIKSNFNSFVFSIPLEVGYSLSNARKGKGLDVKLRYDIGLSNRIDNTNYGSSKGNTLQLFVSLPFINSTAK
jgi:hypothetical protein